MIERVKGGHITDFIFLQHKINREVIQMQLPDKYADVLYDAIDTYGQDAQTDVCIEECSELIKALLKFRRLPMENGQKFLKNIQEEIADVQIMLWQMDLMYGHGYCVEDQIDKKINRLRERAKKQKEGNNDRRNVDMPVLRESTIHPRSG